jgi:hypothetical protein
MNFKYTKIVLALSLSILSGKDISKNVDEGIDYGNDQPFLAGWGWLTLNQAEASMDCKKSGPNETTCSVVVDPCDIYNCNEDPIPDPEPGLPPEQDDGGGGGGSPGTTEPTSDPFIKDVNGDRRNDCWKGLIGGSVPKLNLSSDWGWRGTDFHPAWDVATGLQMGAEARFWGDAKVINKGYDQWNGFFLEFEIVTTKHFVKYIHLHQMPTVNIGGTYKMGESAGIVGGTPFKSDGTYKYDPHLHIAVYLNHASYKEAVAKKSASNTPLGDDMIDYQYSIDPAKLFMSSVCAYPANVTDSDNYPPAAEPPVKPCPTCELP